MCCGKSYLLVLLWHFRTVGDYFKHLAVCPSAELARAARPGQVGSCFKCSPFINYFQTVEWPISNCLEIFLKSLPSLILLSEGLRELFWTRHGDTNHFNNQEQTSTLSCPLLAWSKLRSPTLVCVCRQLKNWRSGSRHLTWSCSRLQSLALGGPWGGGREWGSFLPLVLSCCHSAHVIFWPYLPYFFPFC